jgi:hypothetical protein
VVLGCVLAVCAVALLASRHSHGRGAGAAQSRALDPLRDLPSYSVNVIPASLNVPVPAGGASSASAYASYLSGLCAAAAPYQRQLQTNLAVVERDAAAIERSAAGAPSAAFVQADIAWLYDDLSELLAQEGQVVALAAPASPAVTPGADAAAATALATESARLAATAQSLSRRYHDIALRWYDRQLPINSSLVASFAAGSAALSGPVARVAKLDARLGASGCAALTPPVG